MRNLKKTLVSVVLSGACALTLTAAACDSGEETPAPEPHEHTYSSEWVWNSEQHWHPASCDDTNTTSGAAAHTDADNDGVCDVCGYNYPHTHIYSDEWSADDDNHWHDALCGHDSVSDMGEHETNAAGVCSVCGLQVSTPDVSTIANALEIAAVQADLVETAEGRISYYNDTRGTTSYYSNSTTYHDDYTYLSVTEGWTTEYWFSPTEYGLFVVSSEDGATPTVDNNAYDDDYIYGYRFTNPSDLTVAYYGVTNYVAGLYNYATAQNYEIEESIEEGVYSFSYTDYILTYDEDTGDRTPNSDRCYLVSVSFTLSEDYYIDTMDVRSEYYDASLLDFSAYEGQEEIGQGTIAANATPYIIYTYDYTQGREVNPYDPYEVMVEGFDLADPTTGEIVSGETEDTAGTVNIGLTNNENIVLDITNLVSDTADISLDRLTATVYQYNEASDSYVQSYWGVYTSVNTTENTFTITGSSEGIYLVELTSTFRDIKRYVNVIATPAAPEEIRATINGSEVSSSNLFAGASATISANVDYGYADEFTAKITSENADDASLSLDASGTTYTFTSDTPGTYTITVTSTADPEATDPATDTVDIVVAPAPALSEVFIGTYEMEYDPDNSYMAWDSTAQMIFTPDENNPTAGTLSYSFSLSTGRSTVGYSGTVNYSYDETGAVTITGLEEVAADEAGVDELIVELENYVPTLTVNALYMAQTGWDSEAGEAIYSQRSIETTFDGFVQTSTEVEEPGGETGELTVEELLTTTTWTATMSDSVGDPYTHTLIFNSDGSGVVYCGDAEAGSTSRIYFAWEVVDGEIVVSYPEDDTNDYNAYDMPEIDEVRSTFMTLTDNGNGSYTVAWCSVNFGGTNSGSVGGGDTAPAFVGNEYYCEGYGEFGATIYFDEAGWCAVYDGTLPETGGFSSAIVYMAWELDTNGDIATSSTVYGSSSDPDGYLNGFEAGMIATYDADSDSVSFGGYTFEVPWWVSY